MCRSSFKVISSIILLFAMLPCQSRQNAILSPKIATLQVMPGDNWLAMPIIEIDGETPIVISFDYLDHDYRRLSYNIQHCDADWNVSDGIFTSDYLSGMAEGNVLDDSMLSSGTNVSYTHYRLQLPNENVSFKMSGNYIVTIVDDNIGEEILKACFMVLDRKVSLALGLTTNTDVDTNGSHQQVSMKLNYGQMNITNPIKQFTTVVMQNGRRDNCVVNAVPDYISADGLSWNHVMTLVFNAGNEYHKFEAVDVDHAAMGIEKMHWDGNNYNAYLWPDEPRKSYVYDEDADGMFYIRNVNDENNETMCDYLYVHFALKAPRQNGDVYVNGMWTDDAQKDKYMMTYDDTTQMYTTTLMLKQGYYSYQYVTVSNGVSSPVSTEGNFYQTENRYQALVYYRGNGDRTDSLVGYAELVK